MINTKLRRCVIAAALCGFGAAVHAQDVDLGKITVKGEGMRDADRSFTVNTISRDEIAGRRWENPLAIFEEAPGVEVRSIQGGSVGDFITIRGMTNGGHGGDLGFSLDGVSLNEAEGHSDGYADTQIVVPLEIESLTVYKGPVSPLYGNFARGGVMAFQTRKGGEYTDIHLSGGSWGTYDGQLAFGTEVEAPLIGDLQINGAIQGYEHEGWRDNSRFTKMNLALRASKAIGDRSEVALSLRGHGARSYVPGNTTGDQFNAGWDERRQQSDVHQTQNDMAEKTYNSQRIDFNHNFTDNLRLLTWVYKTEMFLSRYETDVAPSFNPANCAAENMQTGVGNGSSCQRELSHDREVVALGFSFNGTHAIGNIASNWVLGAEYYDEETTELMWRTNSRDRGFVQGITPRLERNRDYVTETTAVFGQIDLDVHRYFRPTLGFRYDSIDQTATLRTDVASPVMRDTRANYDISESSFTPKLGVRSAITDNLELRASYAEGFQLPNIGQRSDANISSLDPHKFEQYELGISGTPHPSVYFDLVYFMLNSSDEIITNPNNNQLDNLGETDRSGIEGEIRYFPSAVPHLTLSAGFGFFDSEIKSRADNPALEGLEIPRVPEHVANVTASYAPPSGWGGTLRWRTVGEMYVSNDNVGTYDGYDVVDATVFYTVPGANGRSTRWYLEVTNIFDEAYADGPGGANGVTEPTTFNARPPASVFAGVIFSL